MWSFVIFSDIKQLRVSKAFQIMQMVWNRGFFSIVACQRQWAEAPPNNLHICQIMRFREMLNFPDFINWKLDTPFHLLGTTTWSKTSKNATKLQLFSETSWARFISNILECLDYGVGRVDPDNLQITFMLAASFQFQIRPALTFWTKPLGNGRRRDKRNIWYVYISILVFKVTKHNMVSN